MSNLPAGNPDALTPHRHVVGLVDPGARQGWTVEVAHHDRREAIRLATETVRRVTTAGDPDERAGRTFLSAFRPRHRVERPSPRALQPVGAVLVCAAHDLPGGEP